MIRIRLMTVADLPLGMRLKAQAGWNQTEADWRRYLRLAPHGSFVAELDGVAVGTTVAFLFGPVAWVAMVLVDEAVRGRGVGTALMRHALAFLDGRGVRSVRLDATPLGRPIYEKLGFVEEYTLTRYEGVLQPAAMEGPEVEPVAAGGLPQILQLDREVTQTNRAELLGLLYEEAPDLFRMVRRGGELVGFRAGRPGSNAAQLGPVEARDEGAARALLADASRRLIGRRVFIDVPLHNLAAVKAIEAMGLTAQRPLLRMGRGEPVRERIRELWASSGPEKG
jgi:GNAT superfamily N-acetyltransferase